MNPQTFTLAVTQRHIDTATRGDCRHCAVALALAEQSPAPISKIVVGYQWAHLYDTRTAEPLTPPPAASVVFPPTVQDFIKKFDMGVPVAPFTVELELTPFAC